jgi:coenzyme F420-reducing hydrogenase delta subunit/ferredoxin
MSGHNGVAELPDGLDGFDRGGRMSVTQSDKIQTAAAPTGAFEPRIMAFVCKWCTYAGADLAGTSRMTYPPNARTLMLPCTGRIDAGFVLRAFLQGADGVIVSGCHPGDCHYTAGNYRARRRWTLFRDLLDVLGVDLRRFECAWISAAEGAKWVKTIQKFTEQIRDLGPYEPMHRVAQDRTPALVPAMSDRPAKPLRVAFQANAPHTELAAAIRQSLEAGTVKAVIAWTQNKTLKRVQPTWILSGEAADDVVVPPPQSGGNLARLFKNPKLKAATPLGIVARADELRAMNVLVQESQLDPGAVTIFAIDADGKFLGSATFDQAQQSLIGSDSKDAATDRPAGWSDQTLVELDQLMNKPPAERWAFWAEQSSLCVKCYACRGSCPMCNCDQCIMEKNQPQWFPTAADGPGNLAWHMIRAFHLAGRCVGCGACSAACPAGIRLDLLNAAMARSAMRHFGHRAGADPKAKPLLSEFRLDDREDFIL